MIDSPRAAIVGRRGVWIAIARANARRISIRFRPADVVTVSYAASANGFKSMLRCP
jgi:hypothetical protein